MRKSAELFSPLHFLSSRELRKWSGENNSALLRIKLQQWHLNRQWQAIRAQAAERELSILGDLPFYVSSDSADVWANRHLFSVNQEGVLSEQSGVPPVEHRSVLTTLLLD